MARTKNTLVFNTAIITYPSDYNKLLTIELIIDKFKSVMTNTTKVVIAQEDPDEDIQRTHYHLYWDDKTQKQVTTNYFDIELPEAMIVFIHPDKTREYKTLYEMECQLGWDNGEEMVAKLDDYIKDKEEYESYEVLTKAHPNLQLKKEWGDKYFMLRYVLKQKLIVRTNFDVEQELKYLEDNFEELCERANELIKEKVLAELNVNSVDELIVLLKKYKANLERKHKKQRRGRKNGKGKCIEEEASSPIWELCQFIRKTMYEKKGITKNEVLAQIKENEQWWFIYASNYLNYNKLLNDLFKNKPLAKPTRNYNFKFWLPRQLYDYVQWLDKWVMNWTTGNKKDCEHRPKGLILIGDSRTGKTSLMSLFGDFTYFKNIWNSDNWEFLPSYTIMDDMDAQDEGKGLNFSWYKPWFGAQDAITITDKYRPKEDIINGKPLIWLNNFDIDETFKSESAQKYIFKNMVYVNIGKRNLYEKPEPFEWIEGHSDYIEFDPKTTWYYKNVIEPQERGGFPSDNPNLRYLGDDSNKENIPPNQQTIQQEQEQPSTSTNSTPPPPGKSSEIVWIDETENIIDQYDDIEPLSDRQKRFAMENEKGRPNKRVRRKN